MYTLQLLVLCATISGHSQQQHSYMNSSKEANVTPVLIIGAGISGLEAARLLRENGIKTLILEGRNRTGGRIWSVRSKSGAMLDLGASYIHGIYGSIPSGLLTNPIWDLIQKAKIPTRKRERSYYLGSYPVDENKLNARNWYNEFINFVREKTRTSSTNQSFEYYTNLFSLQKKLTKAQRYSFFNHVYFVIGNTEGAELDRINAKTYLDLTSIHHGEWRVFDQTGYMALIDYLSRDLTDIRLEQIVTKINYTDKFVEVSTKDGEVYRAEYLLITIPLGVLKSKQIVFNPTLPQWKLDAIDRIGFGNYEKVFLLWDHAWWNSSDFYFLRTSSNLSEFRYHVNANKWNNKSLLTCIFSGKVALRFISKQNQNEVVQEIRDTLQKMFPNIVIPPPVEIYMTNWKEDSFSYGSFSYISTKQKYEDPFYLSEPIADRLLFAGEATSTDTYGYTHGALVSARREVSRLLFVFNLVPKQNPTTSKSAMTTSLEIYTLISFILLELCFYYNRG